MATGAGSTGAAGAALALAVVLRIFPINEEKKEAEKRKDS